MQIIRNMAQCKVCQDIIESKSEHDYVTCSCGAIAVDGGLIHISRTGRPGDLIELSKYLPGQKEEH